MLDTLLNVIQLVALIFMMVSLYRALPNVELAVCPQADHFGASLQK